MGETGEEKRGNHSPLASYSSSSLLSSLIFSTKHREGRSQERRKRYPGSASVDKERKREREAWWPAFLYACLCGERKAISRLPLSWLRHDCSSSQDECFLTIAITIDTAMLRMRTHARQLLFTATSLFLSSFFPSLSLPHLLPPPVFSADVASTV